MKENENTDHTIKVLSEIKQILIELSENSKTIYDENGLMRLLNISKSTLNRLKSRGKIAYSQGRDTGKCWFTFKDIEDFLENNKKKTF